jgi:hypothetical protein
MHVLTPALAVACSISMFAAMPAVAEDLTIVSKVVDPAVGPGSSMSTQYLSPTRTMWSNANYSAISDVAGGKTINIDHQKKQYYETTVQEMEAATRMLQQRTEKRKAEMKETYAKMPPEVYAQLPPSERNRVQVLLGEFEGRDSVSIEKVSGRRKIAGYDCEHYVITFNKALDGDDTVFTTKYDYWVAPDLQIPWYSDTIAAQTKSQPASVSMQSFARMRKELRDKGFMLATTIKSTSHEHSEEAIEVKKGPIDRSVFVVPAGYTKVESPMVSIREHGISDRK